MVLKHALLGLAAVAGVVASRADAHHSTTAFDMGRIVVFEGTVVRFDWTNPHVYLNVEDSDGNVWRIETDATPVMTRSGWTRDSFQVGDSITVRVSPHIDPDRHAGVLLLAQGADGAPLSSLNRTKRALERDPTVTAPSLFGIWHGEFLPIDESARVPLVDAFQSLSTTAKGEAARLSFDESMSPTTQCVAWPSPFILGLAAIYLVELEPNEDTIIFRSEFYGTERIIYMDGREHPIDGRRTNQGHSVGWWEEDVLVVDTTLFSDHRSPYTAGVPSGASKHVIERYTLSEDRTRLLVDIYLEDPEYLAEPFTASLVWNYSPHLEMLELECDPAVAGQFVR